MGRRQASALHVRVSCSRDLPSPAVTFLSGVNDADISSRLAEAPEFGTT